MKKKMRNRGGNKMTVFVIISLFVWDNMPLNFGSDSKLFMPILKYLEIKSKYFEILQFAFEFCL